jgi:C-terminal processing protease CtpA/Prc
MLEGNIGYLYPAMLTERSLDSVKTLFRDTKGLVVDLRCYPTTFMPFTYGAWLKKSSTPFAKFTGGSTDWPGFFQPLGSVSNGGGRGVHYGGKLVIIVDATSQSNAEYTTMSLQSVPGAVTIGSTTAGADGNVSEITLPGGLRTWISGINVLYPDGTETQRTGVKIDRVMQPTPEGIRAGRDELLDAALRIASGE